MTTLGKSGAWRVFLEALAVGVPALAVSLSARDGQVIEVGVALGACAVLPLRRRWPCAVVILCLPALAGGLGWGPGLVALFAVGRSRPRFAALIPWILLATTAAVVPVLLTEALGAADIVLTMAFALLASGAPGALGALVVTRQELTETLRRVQEATAAELCAKAETARADERARIAREIHDAVGHHATLIAVEAAALAATSGETATKEAAGRVRVLAKQSLAEMRAALGLATPEEPPVGLHAIPDLVARTREAGVDVELHDEIDAGAEIAPNVGRAVYRVVQEALTNASKHAAGAEVRVRLKDDDGALRITVVNGVRAGMVVDVGRGGSGLEGLSERVRMAGGELHTESGADGGFALSAVLPRQ